MGDASTLLKLGGRSVLRQVFLYMCVLCVYLYNIVNLEGSFGELTFASW